MLKVEDIMTRDVVRLSGDMSMDRAAWTLTFDEVSGAPVCDANGNIIGILSKSDLIDPVHGNPMDTSVQEAMTDAVWAVSPQAPAIEAVQMMVDKGVHRVVVVNGPGRLAGIVTPMDVMKALLDNKDFHLDVTASPSHRDTDPASASIHSV